MPANLRKTDGACSMRAPRKRLWRFHCVGLSLVLFLSASSGVASATESTIDAALAAYEASQSSSKAFISGIVYYDVNKNGEPESSTDWGIYQAVVQVYSASSGQLVAQTKTSSSGEYYFVLDAGTYIIKNLTQSSLGSTTSVGGIKLESGLGDSVKGSVSSETRDTIDGITVAAGHEGFNYNFGEYSYPLSALSARLLLASAASSYTSGGGPISSAGEIREVPEPSVLALLAVSMGFAFYRIRKAK